MLKADLTIMNGEGYNNIAIDNSIRTAFGLNINPIKTITIRLYGDVERVKGLWRPMFIGFAGYKNENLTIGAEVTYKSNLDTICGHHAWGISGTAGLTVAKKTELFLRYDYSTSRVPQDDILPWNYNKDGVFLITGLQYSFTDNIKFAIDFQGTHPYYSGRNVSEAVFLNALFRF